jgi:hypothetical protein
MPKKYFILMADIIGSSEKPSNQLMKVFQKVVERINLQQQDQLLSPLTITLGDEFQGIVKDLESGVETILEIEESLIRFQLDFKLRYVLHYGTIDTPINAEIAHGMLGKGLATARQKLEVLKSEKDSRFLIDTGIQKTDALLNNLLFLYQSVLDGWSAKDFALINAFWEKQDYKKVAEHFGKVNSLMWKRERSLQLKEYRILKETLALALTCK